MKKKIGKSIPVQSYHQEARTNVRKKKTNRGRRKRRTGFCKWTSLRASGEARILKASYIALLSVPMLARFAETLGIAGFPLYLKAYFFSSLFISFGNVLYAIFCPKLIKRFDSPNEMYRANLEIYESRKRGDIVDEFEGLYAHCLKGFVARNYQNLPARLACFFCLVIGGLFFLLLVAERSLWVLNAR